MKQPEWSGSVLTGLNALDNNERLALWIFKRGPRRMFFNFWHRHFWGQ